MWSDKFKMLNRSFFENILDRLAILFRVRKPTQTKISISPQVSHRVIKEDLLNKFDEVIIIGDVHGCFDEFMLLLDQISIQRSNKRHGLKH